MRILALDLGSRRVGIAKSDPLRMITQPHSTFDRHKGDAAMLKEIAQICVDEEVSEIVIGLPLHMDGRDSDGAVDARKIAALLAEKTSCKVALWDERLSTVGALRHMTEIGVKTKD